MKNVNGRRFETYNAREHEKELKEQTKKDKKTAEEKQEAPVPLATHVNKFFSLTFFQR